MRMPVKAWLPFFFAALLLGSTFAQQSNGPCDLSGFKSSKEKNLFSEQQEQWLGEIIDSSIRRDFNVIDDPDGYLQKLGERLLAVLPPTKIRYHFAIIDSPELNSFGGPGGFIYIHRRMIAFLQNEDELAALLGHEIGHIAAHHVALRMTQWFGELGITSVGDKQDIFNKWNQFKNNAARIKNRDAEKREEEEQLIADRIAVYAMSRAGYNSARAVEFADRLLQTKGKAGSFWSDVFGTTTPEARRLRAIIKDTAPLDQQCVTLHDETEGRFSAWQKSIIESKRATAKEELPGLARKIGLHPQLRSDLGHLQFSPDGKYLLAQDESSIFVLTREPLANQFRIDALDAHTAQFTPDSRSLVFYDKELRVEKWDLASRRRAELHQLSIPECFQSALSPSGQYLACIDYKLGVQILSVITGEVLYSRKNFYQLSFREYLKYFQALVGDEPVRIFDLKFSPDDRYCVVTHADATLAYDLTQRTDFHLSWRIMGAMRGTFAFVSSDEIAGIEYAGTTAKLVRFRFPSGEKLGEFNFQADGWLYTTGSSEYLLVRPAGEYPVGIVDLKAQKIAQAFKTPAFAIYGHTFAGEQNSGEIALFDKLENKLVAKITLPDSPLSRSKASEFSSDGKWLAVSGESRGAVWNLESGDRVFFTHGFDGALFEHDRVVAKFAKRPPEPSRVFTLEPATKGVTKLYDVVSDSESQSYLSSQMRDLLMIVRPQKDSKDAFSGSSTLEVHDVRDNKTLWEHRLEKGRPGFFYNGKVLTLLIAGWDGIRAAAKEDPTLSNRLSMVDAKPDVYAIQVFDAASGRLLGSVLVDTGKLSFKVRSAYTLGDNVYVGDSLNRTLVYSLKAGSQKGIVLGHVVTASANGETVMIENAEGVADLYDAASLQSLAHFSFPSRIAEATFTIDGMLLVLTADQNVYQLKPPAESGTQAVR